MKKVYYLFYAIKFMHLVWGGSIESELWVKAQKLRGIIQIIGEMQYYLIYKIKR